MWVSKLDEKVDPGWFRQRTVDLILVIQGQLRVEFEASSEDDLTMGVGDLLVLPPNTGCRAYRWPRDAAQATLFLAVYPKP